MTTIQSEATARFLTYAPGFAAVVGDNPRLEIVARTEAHEGPVYMPAEDALYVTATPDGDHRSSILRIELASGAVVPIRSGTTGANGMTLDPDGRTLLVCDQGSSTSAAGISRVDPSRGHTQMLVQSIRGLPLNSPNDVVVAPDGSLWFTDPSYGWLQGFRPRPSLGDHVYRYDPRRARLTLGAAGFDKPNGLAFSPDGSVLYVGDSGADRGTGVFDPSRSHHVLAFDVCGGRVLRGRRTFAVIDPGAPDGLKVDDGGRVYVSSATGVQVFGPSGERLGEIALPGAVNFCFGGPAHNQLFITTDDAVCCAHLAATATKGTRVPTNLQGA